MKPWMVLACAIAAAATGCSRSNNLLLGRVEAAVGGHNVVVTDCYRTSVPPPTRVDNTDYFAPCKDAAVQIRNEELIVNGTSYGKLGAKDEVVVDHGAVSILRAR